MASGVHMKNNNRLTLGILSVGAGAMLIAVMSFVLTGPGDTIAVAGQLLLDRQSSVFPYPFTIQNLMWLVFAFGCGELWARWRHGSAEETQLSRNLLPEDEETMLRAVDLAPYYRKVRETDLDGSFFLQRLLTRCILQFQASRSVDQANSLMNSSLELCHHEIELRYNILRYLTWLIPTLGFIGTVIGIVAAMQGLSGVDTVEQLQDPQLLTSVISNLGVAFYTTLLALIQSTLLVFLMHIVQGQEEVALNRTGQYCLDNLINRLYEND